MDAKKRLELIKRNTQEIVSEPELRKILKKKKPRAYIGYATTGLLHVGHLVPIVKIADFITAGFDFTFLAADLHAFLDDLKSPWDKLDARSKVYLELMRGALKAIGINEKKLTLVKGSDLQLNGKYMLDVLKLSTTTNFKRTKRAASEVVRLGDAPKMGGFFYPLMQIADTVALNVDVSFGGVDQRGIYMLGREILPEIGYPKPTCVFMPLIPNLEGERMAGKMSSSSGKKISLLDGEAEIKSKVKGAFCPAGKTQENPVLDLVKMVIFPILEYKKKALIIKRPAKFGGDIKFSSFRELEQTFADSQLHPMDLKNALADELNKIISVIRNHFKAKKALLKKAYS